MKLLQTTVSDRRNGSTSSEKEFELGSFRSCLVYTFTSCPEKDGAIVPGECKVNRLAWWAQGASFLEDNKLVKRSTSLNVGPSKKLFGSQRSSRAVRKYC